MTRKSFLGLFGKGDESDKGSPNKDWREKRGGDRVELERDGTLKVNLQIPTGGDRATLLPARVRNVSMRGCRVEMASGADRERLYVAQIILAALELDDFSIPLQLEVVRLIGEREAAVRFKPPFPKELERLEKFLEPRYLGRSLREIDPAALQRTTEVGKGLRWFQGLNDTNLFSWLTASGHVVQQQLVFLDRVIEWKGGDAVRTGRIRSESGGAGRSWVPAELLDFDREPNAEVVAQSRVMIESSQIDPVIKEAFLSKVR
jgi:hypothetical protein